MLRIMLIINCTVTMKTLVLSANEKKLTIKVEKEDCIFILPTVAVDGHDFGFAFLKWTLTFTW